MAKAGGRALIQVNSQETRRSSAAQEDLVWPDDAARGGQIAQSAAQAATNPKAIPAAARYDTKDSCRVRRDACDPGVLAPGGSSTDGAALV
ncbi:MAG TPA: hypothetical protein VMB73_29370 [Acetobacteraceae bacterium]|jgi:hypothetical protein|nr:hypothetical protein [Acetobacteraceae bacterium]